MGTCDADRPAATLGAVDGGGVVRCLTMLLEKEERMIDGMCSGFVAAALLQMAVGVAVDLQNCALDVGLV